MNAEISRSCPHGHGFTCDTCFPQAGSPTPLPAPKCVHGRGFHCKTCWPDNPVPTITISIDDMPNLKESLGKADTDRIRMHQQRGTSVGGPRTRWVHNPHTLLLQRVTPYGGGAVDDILSGIAALDETGGESISQGRLHVLLACQTNLSSDSIAYGLNIAPRQARKYLAAARLAIFHITRHLNSEQSEIEELIDNPWTIEDNK